MERRILLGVLVRFVQNVMQVRTYLFNCMAKEIFVIEEKEIHFKQQGEEEIDT